MGSKASENGETADWEQKAGSYQLEQRGKTDDRTSGTAAKRVEKLVKTGSAGPSMPRSGPYQHG